MKTDIKVGHDGFVRFVDKMGGDEAIVQAARVSYGKGTKNISSDEQLIRYLMRNNHSSPLEMCEVKFHIRMPLYICTQLLRHRTACLAGDTKLWFDLPHALRKNKRAKNSMSLREIYQKWHKDKHLHNRIKKQCLRMCNEETGAIEKTHIKDIWSNGIKKVFKITLNNNYSVKMTKDHRCLTEKGWMTLEELCSLRESSSGTITWLKDHPALAINGIPLYEDKEWLKEQKEKQLGVQYIADLAGCSHSTIKKKLKKYNLSYTPEERGILTGRGNKGRKRTSPNKRIFTEEDRKKISIAKSGAGSSFWKGGISDKRELIGAWTTHNSKVVFQKDNYKCVICNNNYKLNAHHIDPVWHCLEKAQDIENLITLCRQCHTQIHSKNLELEFLKAVEENITKDFWVKFPEKKPRPLEKRKGKTTKLQRSYSHIKSIELAGEEEVFDIEVEGPFHNFVANGFIVHNSINMYSQRYSEAIDSMEETTIWRAQSNLNKQGSAGTLGTEQSNMLLEEEKELHSLSQRVYKKRLEMGVAREQARKDLPLSNYTELYWKIDLNNLFKFLRLRVDYHAQQEIREFAVAIMELSEQYFPLAFKAFKDYEINSAKFSVNEMKVLKALIGPLDTIRLWNAIQLYADPMSRSELNEFKLKLGLSGE